jgi:hypothetical protein
MPKKKAPARHVVNTQGPVMEYIPLPVCRSFAGSIGERSGRLTEARVSCRQDGDISRSAKGCLSILTTARDSRRPNCLGMDLADAQDSKKPPAVIDRGLHLRHAV